MTKMLAGTKIKIAMNFKFSPHAHAHCDD